MLNSKYKPKSQKYKLSMCWLKKTTQPDPNAKTNIKKKYLCDLLFASW